VVLAEFLRGHRIEPAGMLVDVGYANVFWGAGARSKYNIDVHHVT